MKDVKKHIKKQHGQIKVVLQLHAHTHMHNHTLQNTKGEPIRARYDRSRTRRAHTQGTLHRRLQPLCSKKHEVSWPGFLQPKPHATFMQPLQSPLPKVATYQSHHFP